jgi:hypothetical protein
VGRLLRNRAVPRVVEADGAALGLINPGLFLFCGVVFGEIGWEV